MTYQNVPPALMRPTHHLDVAPMIVALQFQPTDFEYKHGQLCHIPSSSSIFLRPIGTSGDRRNMWMRRPLDQQRTGRAAFYCIQDMERVLLASARNRPGIRFPFPRA